MIWIVTIASTWLALPRCLINNNNYPNDRPSACWQFLPSSLPRAASSSEGSFLPLCHLHNSVAMIWASLLLFTSLEDSLQLSWTDTVLFFSRMHALSFAAFVSKNRDSYTAHRMTQKKSQACLVWNLNDSVFWDIQSKCQLLSTKQAPAHGGLYLSPRGSQQGG